VADLRRVDVPDRDRLAYFYVDLGLSTRQIARELGISRGRVTRGLHKAGVSLPARGTGRGHRRSWWPAPEDLPRHLVDLYLRQKLPTEQVAARLGVTGRTVRSLLRKQGIPLRSSGWANREDRLALPIKEVERLYLGAGLSAEEVGRQLGGSQRDVLRLAHELGWPVRRGGPTPVRGPTEIELLEQLYSDPKVRLTLSRYGVPEIAPGGPIWQRFPRRIALAPRLLRDLYIECGLATQHIELLTGQPAATVANRLRAAGVRLRPPGQRSPFQRRGRLEARWPQRL
jgi:DNA-binding CsgD family transcriptional regulator